MRRISSVLRGGWVLVSVWALAAIGCARPSIQAALEVKRPDDTAMARALDPDHLLAYRLSRRCEDGQLEACQRLGGLYLVGQGVPRIVAHAVSLWTYACDAGSGVACEELARLYTRGEVVALDVVRATDAYARGCRSDRPAACTEVGLAYRDGRLGSTRPWRANRWFRRACDGGDPRGCHELGVAYLSGSGVAADPEAGVALIRGACDDGYAAACVQLSILHRDGRFVAADAARAEAFRIRACAAGDGSVCTAIGLDAAQGGEAAVAVDRWLEACELGDARGCALLARAYAEGEGVGQDEARAAALYTDACRDGVGEACGRAVILGRTVSIDGETLRELYRTACDAGDLGGCHYLAGLFADGVGGPPDPPAAARLYDIGCQAGIAASCVQIAFMAEATEPEPPFLWLERACELDVQACTVLGEIHEGGFWGRPRRREAAALYQRACAAGSARACHRLGTLYYRGVGVEENLGRAAGLERMACELDVAEACATLGFMHSRGLGVPISGSDAQRYLQRACELGHAQSCGGQPSKPTPSSRVEE